MRSILSVVLLAVFAMSAGAQAPSMVRATQDRPVEVEILSASRAVAPGKTMWVAIRLKPARGWHTYWRYAGDAGSAPSVAWNLPSGWKAGEIVWPTPHRMSSPPLATPIEVPRDARVGSTVNIAGRITWVVCDQECVSDEVDLSVTRPVAASPVIDAAVTSAIDVEQQRAVVAGRLDCTRDSRFVGCDSLRTSVIFIARRRGSSAWRNAIAAFRGNNDYSVEIDLLFIKGVGR